MRSRIIRLVSRTALAFSCLFVLSSASFAQQEKGDNELALVGNFAFGVGGGSSFKTGLGVFNFGHYVTQRQEIGVGVIINVSGEGGFEGEEGSTSFLAGPNAFYRYNFSRAGAKAFPYLGLEGGGFFGSGDVKVGYVRPNLGFKYFFKRNVAFDMNVGYSRAFASSEGESGGANLVDGRIGISFIF